MFKDQKNHRVNTQKKNFFDMIPSLHQLVIAVFTKKNQKCKPEDYFKEKICSVKHLLILLVI